MLDARGIVVVPDILANAGGVTASYFEWAQNRQGIAWDDDAVAERLRPGWSRLRRRVGRSREPRRASAGPPSPSPSSGSPPPSRPAACSPDRMCGDLPPPGRVHRRCHGLRTNRRSILGGVRSEAALQRLEEVAERARPTALARERVLPVADALRAPAARRPGAGDVGAGLRVVDGRAPPRWPSPCSPGRRPRGRGRRPSGSRPWGWRPPPASASTSGGWCWWPPPPAGSGPRWWPPCSTPSRWWWPARR